MKYQVTFSEKKIRKILSNCRLALKLLADDKLIVFAPESRI